MYHIIFHGYHMDATATHFRFGCRAVIEQNGSILFSYLGTRKQYLLPGGGAEKGESVSMTTIRECEEECGLSIRPESPFCVIDEYYNEKRWSNTYSKAVIIGQTRTNYDPKEVELRLQKKWIPLTQIPLLLQKASMTMDDIPDAPESTVLAVRHSHYRELCVISLYAGNPLPPIPEDIKSTLKEVITFKD
jgi:ADP-ribose pyrophosphatase YjhB (NUDIX family)